MQGRESSAASKAGRLTKLNISGLRCLKVRCITTVIVVQAMQIHSLYQLISQAVVDTEALACIAAIHTVATWTEVTL